MTNEEIKNELTTLKKELETIIKRINFLTDALGNNEQIESNVLDIVPDPSLKEKFIQFLKNTKKVTETSLTSYIRDLRRIRKLIKQYLNVETGCEIFEIPSLEVVRKLAKDLFENIGFIEFNKRNHYHFSAPLNNYIDFLSCDSNSFDFDD